MLFIKLVYFNIKRNYLDSYLGIFWAFFQPLLTIFVFWFVFEVGFKSRPVSDYPFIVWLVCGLLPWFFFSDAWSKGCNCILDNDFLVTKVKFKIDLLPKIAITSSLFLNLSFILVFLVMLYLFGYAEKLNYSVLLYLIFSLSVLCYLLSLIFCPLCVFARDTKHVVAALLQFGFWLTPIFWDLNIIPEKYHQIISLNPMSYIVYGFRYAVMGHEHLIFTNGHVSFWVLQTFLAVLGWHMFRSSKVHFSDIL